MGQTPFRGLEREAFRAEAKSKNNLAIKFGEFQFGQTSLESRFFLWNL